VKMHKGIKNYFFVAKPGIILGNLISATGGVFLASRGRIDLLLLLWTVIGISLMVASGCVFNNWIDRNIDRKMARTQSRVLAQRRMSPHVAVCYASFLGMAGIILLCAAASLLSAAIVLIGFLIYVGAYSLYLKRTSVYGALIGSVAGAAPPLAGYCGVSNGFDTGALLLFLIFTSWQMAHCNAIAIYRFKDYAAAGIPVLPGERGIAAAKKHIVGYILAFVAAALMLTFGGYTGYSFLAMMLVMGLFWLHVAWKGFKASDDRVWAKKVFVCSILTIAVLSIMMSIDFRVPGTLEMLLACAS